MQMIDIMKYLVMFFLLTFTGSWFIGGIITNIQAKKWYAVGAFIPLTLLWIKWIILYLLVG